LLSQQQSKKSLGNLKVSNDPYELKPPKRSQTNESQNRLKTVSHFEYNTYQTEVFSSFIGDGQEDKRVNSFK